ncbi:MAG: hypothetical protein A3J49_01930 [Gallionellales bacterium RIFCSPHIGHO2_02_FULL_57_16]|nr:MAG: hypothetical protein A3J49_01930 [Gallionellales bacterium RIFCSPHIGHO2_02_FULL_57_16]
MSKKPDKPELSRNDTEEELAHLALQEQQTHPAEALLHEFQAQQIELEMQNEELRRTQAALEETRDRYVDLYEFAPLGYLTLSRGGTITEVNLTGARLLGVERKQLLHRSFDSFVIPEQHDRWNRLLSNTLQRSGANSCMLTLAKDDGECIQVHLDSQSLMTDGRPSSVSVALTDITLLARTEDSLHEWQQFVEYASWGMAIGDVTNQTLKRVNPAFAKMHGYSVEEMIGKKSIDLFASESKAGYAQYFNTLLDAGYHAFECVRLRNDGSTFPAVMDASIIKGFDGKANYIVSVKDFTERKDAERRMRELTAHIQTIREEEKAIIAREIHDDLGGTLTALKMEAYWLAEELSASNKAEPLLRHVELISQLTENAVNVTRRVITGLRPTILDDLGLLAALEWQAEQFYKHTGISCRVNGIEDKDKLDKQCSIALFRIFQETLTNVARHSGASRVEVEFHCCDEEAMLSVSDNGCGLPDGHTVASTSYGLRGMNERVAQLGGKISFGSRPGGGYTVTATLPLYVDRRKEERA